MKLIKTLENKPSSPAPLTDVLIGGQVFPTHRRMFMPSGDCSHMLCDHDRVWAARLIDTHRIVRGSEGRAMSAQVNYDDWGRRLAGCRVVGNIVYSNGSG